MNAINKYASNRMKLSALVIKSRKKFKHNLKVIRPLTTDKHQEEIKYSLFALNDKNAILQDILGNILSAKSDTKLQAITRHLDRFEPSQNRNWSISINEREKSNCIRGMDDSLKHQLLSKTVAIKEIERHIEQLNANSNKDKKLAQNSLMTHQMKFLRVSVEGAKLYTQYSNTENFDITEFRNYRTELEILGETILESLDTLKKQHTDLKFDDFKIVILALGFWYPIHNQSVMVKNKVKMKIDDLLHSLTLGSIERTRHLKLQFGKESPLYLNNISDRLDLAQIWIFALTGTDGNDFINPKKIRFDSYPGKYIWRATNSKLGNPKNLAIFVSALIGSKNS